MRIFFQINTSRAEQCLAHTQMKKSATHSRNQPFDLEPADDNTAGTVDNSGTMEPDNGHDLAALVWKYFGEKISETPREVQAALAPIKGSSTTARSRER